MSSEEELERQAEADAMPLNSAIGNLKGLADGDLVWGETIPPESATACVDVVLAALAHRDKQIAEVTRQRGELVEAVDKAADALARSYDATEWPANGQSYQEKVRDELRQLAARLAADPAVWCRAFVAVAAEHNQRKAKDD